MVNINNINSNNLIPSEIPNWINGNEVMASDGELFDKISPSTGSILCRVARSQTNDISQAISAAKFSKLKWATTSPVKRAMILHEIVKSMQSHHEDLAYVVAAETGKSFNDAYGETNAAIELGLFYASEGQRLYGRTTTSGAPNKQVMSVRQPAGIAALIIAANTPIANVAWKVFPALICGNTSVLKAAEDTPATAWLFTKIAHGAGLPAGVLNTVQGLGEEAGAALVESNHINVISFTGSTKVGREIAALAGKRLTKVSLELGGKNPLVVCDDADLEKAVNWTVLSAFSNAGQRCAAGSRIIIFDSVYDDFRDKLIEATKSLRVGSENDDNLGPVINKRQLDNMLQAIEDARQNGASIIAGGYRLDDEKHCNGFFLAPTIIENADPDDKISTTELFGPITCLYRVRDFEEALALANNSPYGLTACIHTRNINRALEFCKKVEAGVAVVNAGTFGSEPHMPFGGIKQSGNGWREPGTEALDIYSELKNIYINIIPEDI